MTLLLEKHETPLHTENPGAYQNGLIFVIDDHDVLPQMKTLPWWSVDRYRFRRVSDKIHNSALVIIRNNLFGVEKVIKDIDGRGGLNDIREIDHTITDTARHANA